MRASDNNISIGRPAGGDLSFNGDEILSINYDNTVDIIGDELAIDTFTPVVEYEGESEPEAFIPTDYDAFLTNDSPRLTLCGHYEGDMADAYYGEPVYYNRKGSLFGKYYIKSVERIARTQYQINAMSAIGILDLQYHVGSVYTGQTAQTVITQIIGNSLSYSFNSTFGNTKVYGWLPYDTKRNNLHRLLFALGGSILKDANGDMLFTFLDATSSAGVIEDSNVYLSGTVTANLPLSEVRVTEHSYQYLPKQPATTLFDNSNALPVTNQLVKFSSPVYASSITASGLTVSESGANYAIVSGKGTLTGIPYIDVQNIIRRTRSGLLGETKTIEIKDVGLINPMNSENVADRLMAYYSAPNEVNADFVNEGERCGNRYSFTNAFGETITAFLSHVSNAVTTIIKSAAKFIQNYTPTNVGNNYNNVQLFTNTSAQTVFNFPSGVTKARLVLIGGGDGGSGGAAGDVANKGKGGEGGLGGNGGNGGKIEIVTVNVSDGDFIKVQAGTAGTGGSGSTSHSSNPSGGSGAESTIEFYHFGTLRTYRSSSGNYSETGYYEPTYQIAYALPGERGIDGGDGGDSGYCTAGINDTDKRNGKPGEPTGNMLGGAGGIGACVSLTVSCNKEVPAGGGGGGGASATGNGTAGTAARINQLYKYSDEEFWDGYGGNGGNGANASVRSAATVYGGGGDGGHGGGGAGAGGTCEYVGIWTGVETGYPKSSIASGTAGSNGTKGNGGSGGNGKSGICIVYY